MVTKPTTTQTHPHPTLEPKKHNESNRETFVQFRRIALKRLLYNTTSESCLERNIFRIQFCKIVSKDTFWEYNSVELPQRERESVGIQLWKVAPKECRVRMQFHRIASKRILLDATSAECFRKKYYFDDIDPGSQFWSWIFNSGSDLIFDLGLIFFFFFLNLDDDLGSIFDFRLKVKFLFSWWWLRVKIHLHLTFSGWL